MWNHHGVIVTMYSQGVRGRGEDGRVEIME